MLPIRWTSAYLDLILADPAWIRIVGVATALIWVALLWKLVGPIGGRLSTPLRALSLALLGLGVLPLLLVWGRPEQVLLVTVITAVIVVCRPDPAVGRRAAIGAAAIVFAAGIVALSVHLKGVVLMPVFLAATAMSSRGKEGRVARVAAIALLAACAAVAFRYWVSRFACPADAVLAVQLGR